MSKKKVINLQLLTKEKEEKNKTKTLFYFSYSNILATVSWYSESPRAPLREKTHFHASLLYPIPFDLFFSCLLFITPSVTLIFRSSTKQFMRTHSLC